MIDTPTAPGAIEAVFHQEMAAVAAREGTTYTPATTTTPAASDGTPATPPAAAPVALEYNDEGLLRSNAPPSAAGIATLRQFGLEEADASYMASGKELLVSPEVRERAATTRARLMADSAWVARFLAGGQEEAKLMMACNIRLAARVV